MDGVDYEYLAFSAPGDLFRGERVKDERLKSGYGYVSSPLLRNFIGKDFSVPTPLIDGVREVLRERVKPVFSNEGWCTEAELFYKSNFFQQLNLRPEIFIFARPPVEWINSAWWQWGAWSDVGFERWLDKSINDLNSWAEDIELWGEVKNVEAVRVSTTSSNVINSFFKSLNCGFRDAERRANSSLPGSLLRVFQRNRELRPGPHDSKIDFMLSEKMVFDTKRDPTPWVLTERQVKKVLEETVFFRDVVYSNTSLSDKVLMSNDLRWWSSCHYVNKKYEEPEVQVSKDPCQEAVLVSAIRALIR